MLSSKHMLGPTTLAAPLQILNAKKLAGQGLLRSHLVFTAAGEERSHPWQELCVGSPSPQNSFLSFPSQPQHSAWLSTSPLVCAWEPFELPEAPTDNLMGALAWWAGASLTRGFSLASLQPPCTSTSLSVKWENYGTFPTGFLWGVNELRLILTILIIIQSSLSYWAPAMGWNLRYNRGQVGWASPPSQYLALFLKLTWLL